MSLQKPKKLSPSDTIGVIAPSAGSAIFFPHRIDTAVSTLKALGYKVKFSPHSLENDSYTSATAEERAGDINSMFSDPEVHAIICTIGGNHSNQILKYLDFDTIRKNPKIFVGFSDISVLHYAFIVESNLQTFYGPCLMTQFGEFPKILPYTLEYFDKVLVRENNQILIEPSTHWTGEILDWTIKKDLERPRNLIPSHGYEWLRKGVATAQIIGGCIPSINHLIGTKYWIDPTDKILFFDIPEGHEFGKGLPPSDIDSYLADFDNMGIFAKIKGLVIGRPYNYSDEETALLKLIIKKYTTAYDYPILFNVNLGHCDPIVTLPLLAEVSLDSENNIFSINEASVI